jgi:uncharacterized membrane protein YgcG
LSLNEDALDSLQMNESEHTDPPTGEATMEVDWQESSTSSAEREKTPEALANLPPDTLAALTKLIAQQQNQILQLEASRDAAQERAKLSVPKHVGLHNMMAVKSKVPPEAQIDGALWSDSRQQLTCLEAFFTEAKNDFVVQGGFADHADREVNTRFEHRKADILSGVALQRVVDHRMGVNPIRQPPPKDAPHTEPIMEFLPRDAPFMELVTALVWWLASSQQRDDERRNEMTTNPKAVFGIKPGMSYVDWAFHVFKRVKISAHDPSAEVYVKKDALYTIVKHAQPATFNHYVKVNQYHGWDYVVARLPNYATTEAGIEAWKTVQRDFELVAAMQTAPVTTALIQGQRTHRPRGRGYGNGGGRGRGGGNGGSRGGVQRPRDGDNRINQKRPAISRECYVCGKNDGHIARNCPDRAQATPSA